MSNPIALQLIRDERQKVQEQIKALKVRDADLADAERKLGEPEVPPPEAKGLSALLGSATADTSARDWPPKHPRGQAGLVLDVLRESASIWMDQAAISRELEARKTPIIPTSLQPVLSKLRREGLVAKNGKMLVAHPSRVKQAAE